MGSTTSKPAPPGEKQLILESPKADSATVPAETVGQAEPTSHNGTLTLRNIAKWDSKTSKDPKLNLARTILVHSDISSTLLKREAVIKDPQVFNTDVGFKTGPTTNQRASGRCWLFATTNVLRYTFAQKLNLKEFELSQGYLFFWDKLNKANYFLELSIQLADQPADARLWSHLRSVPLNDGGQWDMAINLFGNYGVVPQAIFPESFSSSSSGRLNALLTSKVREHSLILRRLNASMRESPELAALLPEVRDEAILKTLRAKKEEFMAEIWTIMTISLGTPPKPDTKFTWEYVDADGKFHSWSGTPVEFYKQFSHQKFPPTESFSLINDPRNAYDKRYTVEYLGNVWGGQPIRYINTTSQRLKEATIASIKNGQPVFFGCDVGQSSERTYGIMDTDLYDYENAFGIKLGLNKAERVQVGESLMTHAMVISAVHLDSAGKPVRYKVENSWGETAGDHGYFVMTDKWFDEYVYQVVIPRALAPKDLVEILDGAEETVLPAWDPMGNLA